MYIVGDACSKRLFSNAPRWVVIRKILSTLLLVLVALFVGCPDAAAQQDVSSIVGTITDPSGKVVPSAKVHIVNESTGISQDLITDHDGYYQSQPLAPGSYSVTAAMKGFSTSSTLDLVVDAAAQVAANMTLQVGSFTTTVTVESAPPALNTQDAEIGNTIDTRAVEDLPVNGRSALALALLSPGVVSGVGAVSDGFTNRGTAVSAIRISGGVMGSNNNLLDGVSNLQSYLGEIAINVKADAVSQFRIMTGVIPAQFGYTSGGVINVVTRSGGNQFHGSLYEFFRNDALDAVIAFPRPTFGKPELRFNNYGGTFGGPIKRDKAFFFANYEEYRYISETPSYSSVPTPQERGGDFSDLGQSVTTNGVTQCQAINIYDPTTGGNTTPRTQFPKNMILADRQDKVALAEQATFYPLPNNTSGAYDPCSHANNYIITPKLFSNEKQAVGRVDYLFSSKDSVFARYAYYLNYQNNASGYSSLFGRNDTLQNYDAVLSETHVFSPTLVNDVRIAGLRSAFPFADVTANQGYAQKLGLPNDTPYVAPVFNNGLIETNGTLGFRASTTFELVDDVTKTFGSHTFHFGFDGRFNEAYNNQTNDSSGLFNFSASQTGAGTGEVIQAGTGSTYASFLLGEVGTASIQLGQGTAFRKYQYAGYFQDNWHANQRLTLNIGMRYDYQPQAYEKHNSIDDFDITRINTVNGYLGAVRYAGVNGEGRNFVPENFNDWGPRIGFALVLTNDNKTVARGGFAFYYPTTAQASYDAGAGNTNGFGVFTTTYTSATANGASIILADGYPYTPSPPLGAAGGQNAFLGATGYYVEPEAKDPQSQQYTLTLSRELPFQTVLDVSYLGNHGIHFMLPPTFNINQLDPQYYSLGTAYLSAPVANPYAGKIQGTLGNTSITRANLLKPYPYMVSVDLSDARGAHFDGNYLYVSVQRRVQRGLQIISAYTYGKLMDLPIYTDLASTAGIQTGSVSQNTRDLNAEYSVDAFDVTHRATIAVLYDLPLGRGQRYFSESKSLDYLLGGIQLNVIMTAESGRPLGITGANNQGIAIRPNFKPGVNVKPAIQNRGEWFNPNAFENPADYTFGNVPRYYSQVRGPGAQNLDISLFKTTHITKGTSLQLRLEAFNALNKVNLQQPNTTFTAGPALDPNNTTAEGGSNINPNFGAVLASQTARQVQLAAKIIF